MRLLRLNINIFCGKKGGDMCPPCLSELPMKEEYMYMYIEVIMNWTIEILQSYTSQKLKVIKNTLILGHVGC